MNHLTRSPLWIMSLAAILNLIAANPATAHSTNRPTQYAGILIVHCRSETSTVFVDGRETTTCGLVRQYQLRLKEGPHVVRIVDSGKCHRSPFYVKQDQTTYVVQWKTCPLINDCCPDGSDLKKDRDYWKSNVREVSHREHYGRHISGHHQGSNIHGHDRCDSGSSDSLSPRCGSANNPHTSHSGCPHCKKVRPSEQDFGCEQCCGKSTPQPDPKKTACEHGSGHASKQTTTETEPVCKECEKHERGTRQTEQQKKCDVRESRDDEKGRTSPASPPKSDSQLAAKTTTVSASPLAPSDSPKPAEPRQNSCVTNEKRWSYTWRDGRPAWLEKRDGATVENGVMKLEGGAILPLDVDGQLLEKCRQTNQLCVEAVFHTTNRNQEGPARIVSFSSGSESRNFTLAQKKDKIIFRLKTSKRKENDDIEIGDMSFVRPMHIIVSYDGKSGELCVYINGQREKIAVMVDGDLQNWNKQQLIIGSEFKDDSTTDEHDPGRTWRGTVERLAISNSAITEAEAKSMYQQVVDTYGR